MFAANLETKAQEISELQSFSMTNFDRNHSSGEHAARCNKALNPNLQTWQSAAAHYANQCGRMDCC